MKNALTAMMLLAATMAVTGAWADNGLTDVTAQYVTNASFEADNVSTLSPVNNQADGLRGYSVAAPSGWTVTNGANAVSLLVTADCYTDNNFGKVTTLADGQQAYYLRMGWSTGTTSMRQTVKALPKGKYMLQASVRSAYVNEATSRVEMTAGNEGLSLSFAPGAQGCFTSMEWSKESLVFEQKADGDATIAFDVVWLSGGSCVMIDDVRLYQLGDDYVDPDDPSTPSDDTALADFVGESAMQSDLLQMLANFATYMKNDFQDCQWPNSIDEACGCFKGENTMANDERGVRPNADLSMICAFLVKYGKDKVTLPAGVTWDDLEQMAMKSLVFAYSTHKANKLKVCSGGNYWGSVSNADHVWESSLWAMSVAYSAFFQWNKLSDAQKNYIYQLLKAECNYELERTIPTGYNGDTKAEENGWEADILAATLGLFPNDPLAPQWFQRLREFAINSYSHKDDATDNTIIDPDYDQKRVRDLYKGRNLYDDYSLQNHNYFHTSYQNVVIQELGEAALALKLFQLGLYGTEQWKTNALMHNNDKVMEEVLYWLALADGELAMPNGNDWSLFLYDQITSYSTNACFLRDPHALMLENLAYKMIKARQKTTADGSWLLRSDVGARRMGVEAHRVMMTWLMHDVLSTADMTATTWPAFNRTYSQAKHFTSQNIVRASTDSRFTCFSWSKGLNSYTGYISPHGSQLSPLTSHLSNLIVPFRANNTGNFLGWYEVQGKATNATPVVSGIYDLRGNSYVMNGELNTNDASLNHRFAIYSTPGNAVIYLDNVSARQNVTINKEKGGLMAISMDELTKTRRTLYYPDYSADFDCQCFTTKKVDGAAFTTLPGPWVNIDNTFSIVSPSASKSTAFGEKANNNSVMTAKLYASYSDVSRAVKKDSLVDSRAIAYYSNITAEQTNQFFQDMQQLTYTMPKGWNGVIVPDGDGEYGPDCTYFMLLSNFAGEKECTLKNVYNRIGNPVFTTCTTISSSGSTATFTAEQNHSVVNTLKFFINGTGMEAIQAEGDSCTIYLLNLIKGNNKLSITAFDKGKTLTKDVMLSTKKLKVSIVDGELQVEDVNVSKPLSGTPMGSRSIDYASGKVSQTVNTPSAAFDADPTTFYASYDAKYAWVGLDLGSPHVIDRVSFAPATEPAGIMQLGVFEGANEPDFSDAIPFHVIKDEPASGETSTQDVACSRGFRYVRYIGPNGSHCNVAELSFYGTEGKGDDSRLYQMTNQPLLIIHTVNNAEVTSRETYLDGWLSVISEDGTSFFTDTLKIRGRGNGSWDVSNTLPYGGVIWRKLPYRLKLAHKTKLLGMPAKAKNWVLLNNLSDKTLIRNMVAFEASRRMGMDYTPAAKMVDVMYNGELKGTYQLADKIEVGKNRINIESIGPDDNEEPNITGGYLIEIDASQGRESPNVIFKSAKGNPVTIQDPDEDAITPQQYDYIKNAFNSMEAKVYGSNPADPVSGYPSALDVDAFLKHFLVGEFSGNTDTYWSIYMSKDRGADEKFKCCTVWDFDLAFENDLRTYPINDLTDYLCLCRNSSAAGDMKNFVRRIANTQQQRICELWTDARTNRGFTPENILAYVDSLAQELELSQTYNFLRWPILDVNVQKNFQALGSYDKEVAFMKQYIADRFVWMDEKTGYLSVIGGIADARFSQSGHVYVDGQGIHIAGFQPGCTYRIFNANGQFVTQGQTAATTVVSPAVRRGVYIVAISNQQGTTLQRKIIVE